MTVKRHARINVTKRIVRELTLFTAVSVDCPNVPVVSFVDNLSVRRKSDASARYRQTLWITRIIHSCQIQMKGIADVGSNHLVGGLVQTEADVVSRVFC